MGKVVFTNGCFDLLHVGHIMLLEYCRQLAGWDEDSAVLVGMNSDTSVSKLKGDNRPIIPERQRYVMLQSLQCKPQVLIFNEETPYKLIQHYRPDIIIKGRDYNLPLN